MTSQTPLPEDPRQDFKLSALSLGESIDAIRVAQGKVSIKLLTPGTPEFTEAEDDMLRMTLTSLGGDPDDDSDDFLDELLSRPR